MHTKLLIFSFVRTMCLRVRLLRVCPTFCLLYNRLLVDYEKFQFHERFAMIINDFKDHKSVLCSRLFGTVCHVNLFERIRLVRVPVWTLFVLVKRMWLQGRVSAYPAGRLCVYWWRLVGLC